MMNPIQISNLALLLLQQVLALYNEIKSQGGLTDDQIEQQVQTISSGNDALYGQLMAALNIKPPAAS
jgi:hypothetical protein